MVGVAAGVRQPRPAAEPTEQAERARDHARDHAPLWQLAADRGLIFGTAMSSRLLPDQMYSAVVDRETRLLLAEDDLLWYRLRPTPGSPLDFTFADRLYEHAQAHRQLVLGAHLLWDEGLGPGWTGEDLWGISERRARDLLFGTVRQVVRRYRGRTAGWIVANEVTTPAGDHGYRTNVPWWRTIGREYVGKAFHVAHEEDRGATLVLNEHGFETDETAGDLAADRRRASLQVVDHLLATGAPVHALGVQAHLAADGFARRFDARAYQAWLTEVADRGLAIVLTELDCLDDGLPADARARDTAVGDAYRRYLDVTLSEPAVKAVVTFGLSDRHTWLQEDFPRPDGAARRPLPYDRRLRPKDAYVALARALLAAPSREPLW